MLELIKRVVTDRLFWLVIFVLTIFLKSHVITQILVFLVMILGLDQFKNLLLYWLYRLSRISEFSFPWGTLKLPTDSQVELPSDLKVREIDSSDRRISYDLYTKATQMLSSGAIHEAIALAEAAVERYPNNFEANLFLGFAYDITPINNPAKAVHFSREALKLQPRSFIPQFNLAVATNHVEGYQKSMSEYEKAEEYAKEQNIDDKSEIIGKLNLFLAHDYLQSGRLKDAKDRYEKAKEILANLVSKGDKTSRHWLEAAEKSLKDIAEKEGKS